MMKKPYNGFINVQINLFAGNTNQVNTFETQQNSTSIKSKYDRSSKT